MTTFDIKRFDPSTMASNATVFLVGKRGTGKSTLIADIMYHNRSKFHYGIGMSATEEVTGDLGRFIPRSCLYHDFTEGALSGLMAHQKKDGAKVKRAQLRGEDRKLKPMFVVMDDCAFDKKTLSNSTMREAFMNGRHRALFIVNAVQYMMDIPSSLRGQIDYVFATRDNIRDQREKLYKYFFGIFDDFETFSRVLDECTQGHSCIVLDGKSLSNKVEDVVFHYQADPDLPEFRLCADIYWEMDTMYSRDEDVEATATDTGNGKVSVRRLE